MPANDVSEHRIVPFDALLDAEVRGINFAETVDDTVRAKLREAWQTHLILLLRGQSHI